MSYASSNLGSIDYFSITAKLGLNYFFTPSVALGPALAYTHAFNNDPYVGYNQFNFLVAFGIYL